MSPLNYGLTPKMRPLAPKRAALVVALDVGTSKIACLIAKLKPQPPQEVLRRRSHAIEVIGFSHTESFGMKAGNVVDLVEAEPQRCRQDFRRGGPRSRYRSRAGGRHPLLSP